MNVSLTPELDKFVASKVESGEYATASEVVRDGLRMLRAAEETRQAKLEALRMDIQKGFQGTPVEAETAYEMIRKGMESPHRDGTEVMNKLKARYQEPEKLKALREEIGKGQVGPYHDLDQVLDEMQTKY